MPEYTPREDESGQASFDLHQVDNVVTSSPNPQVAEPVFPTPDACDPPKSDTSISVVQSLNPNEIGRIRQQRLSKEIKTVDYSGPSSDRMYQSTYIKRTLPHFEASSDSMLDREFIRQLQVTEEKSRSHSPSPSPPMDPIERANIEVSTLQKILLKRHMGIAAQQSEPLGRPNRMTSTHGKTHARSVSPGSTDHDSAKSQLTATDSMHQNENIPLLERKASEVDSNVSFNGRMHFPTRQGNKDASFLSLPSGPIPENLVSLMNGWGLEIPTIILSLPGSAQLSNNSRFRQVLKDNFIRIAATTKVWFLTEGVNKSISAFLGSCLQSHAYKRYAKREQNQRDYLAEYDTPVPIIGLVSPESVHNGEMLLTTHEQKSIPYSRDSSSQARNRDLLDMNHSHFILMRGFKDPTVDCWHTFEDRLSKQLTQGKYTLPVVRIIVDNTLQVIEKVSDAVLKDVVTVVISSNMLMRLTHDFIFRQAAGDQKKEEDDREKFLLSCRHFLGADPERSDIDKIIEYIENILRKKNFVTMFDMNLTYGADLSKTIVVALLKSNKSTATGKAKLKEALGLVIDWNRVDLADQDIFTESLTWGDADLFQHFFKVLDLNQVEFLDLMLERNVVDIASFVEHNLERLYFNSTARNNNSTLFNKLIELANIKTHSRISLFNKLRTNQPREASLIPSPDKLPINKIGKLINYIMERSFESIYEKYAPQPSLKQKEITDNPIDNLFIWAILTQRWRMAEVLLNYSNHVIFNAVAAKTLIAGMYQRLKDVQVVSESDLEVLKSVSNKFEQTAVGIMEEACRRDAVGAHRILLEKNELFDENNCIEIAVAGRCMTFLSHPCVQTLLDLQWKEPLYRHNPMWKKLLAMVFPFLIFILIDFSDPKPVNFLHYLRFYSSPSIKFITYVISFILYLLLYSYVVLFRWYPFPNLDACEWVFIVWSLTYVVEEFRQLFGGNGKFKKRVLGYFRDRWNQFDTAFVVFFLVGTIFRLIPQIPLEYSRHMFAFFGFILFFRILQFLIILRDSGPFVYMVFRMLRNLTHFVVLALIFLLAYGVPSQALLYPNVSRNDNGSYIFVIGNIFFRPYFQAFGEFFIEHISENSNPNYGNFGNSNPEIYLSSKIFVYIFLLVWIILSNILLVNLIIAKFNNTFVEIESNAALYWKYKFFNSVSEFRDKPVLPPPFNVFVIVYRCFKKAILYFFVRLQNNSPILKKPCDSACELRKYEKKCVLACKFNSELTHERNIEDRISCLDNRLMNTQQLLVSVKGKIDSLQWGPGDFVFDSQSEREGFNFQTENMGSML